MNLRINYLDGTEKRVDIKKIDIIPVPEEDPNFPTIFNISNISGKEIIINVTSNIISDISEVKNIDFVE
jgi:hypothetical protein